VEMTNIRKSIVVQLFFLNLSSAFISTPVFITLYTEQQSLISSSHVTLSSQSLSSSSLSSSVQGLDDNISHQNETKDRSQNEYKFSVGVLADIQYAPIADGTSFAGIPRYYRHALTSAKVAAEHFQREGVSLVLNLGDTIDGKCQQLRNDGYEDPGLTCIQHVLEALSPYQCGPILHTYGNHELYNLSREQIEHYLKIPFAREKRLHTTTDLVGYYSHSYLGIRFVVLDAMDICSLRPESSAKRQNADWILQRENPNYPTLENSSEGLEGLSKRFVAFNGGIDQPQMEWLQQTLQQAREAHERVILLSHLPLYPGSCSPVTLVWNYDEVISLLRKYSDVVVLSLAGHAHRGGYQRDEESGIHFRVVEAVLETPPPGNTYAILHIYNDKVELEGYGDCESAVYDMDHLNCQTKVNLEYNGNH
jgi:manganese-dependent ADP-ribose/CDP-alcohol diphosphatase